MIEVKLNDIGEGMMEADVLQFFVSPGQRIKTDEPLLEVQTDKMTAEIPAPSNGIVGDILVEPGATVAVGTVLLTIETEESQQKKVAQMTVKVPSKIKRGQRVMAAPYTRKIARDNNIDIELVKGTGPGGRITEEDLFRHMEKPVQTSSELEESGGMNTEAAAEPPVQVKKSSDGEGKELPETIPFRGRRKQIAQKMTKSLYTIPHVTHFEEADVTELIKLKQELKGMGHDVSLSSFFIKAVTIALKDHRIFHSRLDEANEQIILQKDYNIGIAVDTEEGLIVPVIRHADRKTIKEIHMEMKELNKKALEGQLKPGDISGGTFTISNVGPMGSIGATPIINYPETGLMAFHKIKKAPIVTEQEDIAIRSMMNVSMSFDHRVADGATAISFTNRFASLIEKPNLFLLELI